MRIAKIYSHRSGRDILESPRFNLAFKEFLTVLKALPPYRAANIKKTSPNHVVSPGAMNRWLDDQLCIKKDWDWHPRTIESEKGDPETSLLRSDYRKNRIEVEVQFGNVARYTYDVYKMAISMALDTADVGIMVLLTKKFADMTGGNIAYYERAVRELSRSKMTLIVPLAVIGIEPEDWNFKNYQPAVSAPKANAKLINKARKLRGQTPVPKEAEQTEELSLYRIRRIVALIA